MVCTFLVQYSSLPGDTAQRGVKWDFNFDPPEEIAGKECIIKLVHGETSYVSGAPGRIPLVVQIPGITQVKSRSTFQIGNISTSDAMNNVTIGYVAANDTGGIQNPSIHCFIPSSPQMWKVLVDQLNVDTGYIGGPNFFMSFFLQITPITKS